MKRKKTYRNKIDAMLGITVGDLADLEKRSHLVKQRRRQAARWNAHRQRKASA